MASNPAILLGRALLREGLTITAGAARLSVSGASLSRILNGNQCPREDLQSRIEQTFGVPRSAWRPQPRSDSALHRILRRSKRAPALAATGTEG